MTLSRQRVAELVAQVDPDENPTDIMQAILAMSDEDWGKFTKFIGLIEEEAVSGHGSWIKADDVDHHVRILDQALNPTQARSALARDPALVDVVSQAIPVLQAARVDVREVNLLRAVYEASRGFLRHNGIDQQKAGIFVDRMDDAVEKVKRFDSGHDEKLAS